MNTVLSVGSGSSTGRRGFLGLLGGGLAWGLTGCSPLAQDPIRVGVHVWPGYELIYLARHLGLLNEKQVRLIETPSATASLRSFATGAMEAACLTLDEVLSARDEGVNLTVVAVLDVSMGADALLVKPDTRDLADLRGKRIGVEQTAVGAVMLDAVLQRAGLGIQDVTIRFTTVDVHEAAFAAGDVDALITYEPTKSRLLATGAVSLFTSADVPGLVVDVLAVRTELLDTRAEAIRHLVMGHFQGLRAWSEQPGTHAPYLSQRLGLPAAEVPAAFAELELPDPVANSALLAGDGPLLMPTVERLGQVMHRAGLIKRLPDTTGILSGKFV